LLLRDQNSDVAAPKRVRHSNVEERLVKCAAPDAKSFYAAFTGTVAILKTGWNTQFDVRPGDRSKHKALAGSLLEAGLGFLDLRILFDRGLEDLVQRDGKDWARATRYQNY
jgi:hypothetical protein